MRNVISEFHVNGYVMLSLDGPVPMKEHKKYRIDGVEYDIVPVYDISNSIAIIASGTFVGKTVEFI